MKFLNIKAIIASIAILFASCDVERFPYDNIDSEMAFETIEDASYWNNIIYSNLRSNVYGIFMFSTDVQADQLNATVDYGNRNGGPHRWDFLSGDYTIRDVWQGTYRGVANINRMLEGFETIELESSEDKEKLDQYIGEAYFARAFYFHNLVVRYANMYNPATASSDLGIPLVLNYDVDNKPDRATVQETYDQILDDISTAKSKLSNLTGKAASERITIDIVKALEARVRLYMHDWSNAADVAADLINSGNYALYTSAEDVKKMWHNDSGNEDIFTLAVIKPDEMPNANSIYLSYDNTEDYYRPDFIPTKWVVDEFDNEDFRKGAYFLKHNLYLGGAKREGYWLVNKYPGNPELWTSNNSNYAHKPKVFRIGETYLIAAEASFMADKEADALKFLNDLKEARGLEAVDLSGDDLLEEIKNERMKELAFEGFRLDDLRRWDEGFERHGAQSLDFIMVGANFNEKKVDAGHLKYTWGIPDRDRTVNTNIKQNEGW